MSDRMQALHAWLDRVVGAHVGPLEPASTDASFRRYFRVRLGEGSAIVMDAPPEKEDCGRYVRVASVLRDAGLKVPEVLAADPERGFLLLSDFGCTPYLAVLDEETAPRLYREALDALLLMQVRAPTADLPEYDDARLRTEMGLFRQWLLDAHLELPASAVEDAALEAVFEPLCRAAAEQPRVFVHRDYHSRNLMVLNGGHPGILDFQDAVRGPLTYDLLSLLRDVYVRWPEGRVRSWACDYRERLVTAGLLDARHRERFLRWFDLMGVQRHLKIAGIFARLYHRDGKSAYLPDIPLALDYLREECAPYAELAPLAELLERLQVRARVVARNAEIFGE